MAYRCVWVGGGGGMHLNAPGFMLVIRCLRAGVKLSRHNASLCAHNLVMNRFWRKHAIVCLDNIN